MQDSSQAMSVIIQSLLSQSPILLVLIAGLVVAIAMLGRCRGAAIVAIIGIAIQLLMTFFSLALQATLMQGGLGDPGERARLVAFAYVLINAVRAAGLAALIGAVFMGRSAEDKPLD